jgi:4-cresol dehydrogenase (hydroxylating)
MLRTVAKDLDNALREWTSLLGGDCVIVQEAKNKYGPNEVGATRRIPAALKPHDIQEVVAVVKIAGKYEISLYPISRGHNWGYGATLPVTDDCVIVDLSEMNRILDFDEDLGVVTVEPGATAKQLYDFISEKDLPYLVPVCGAGPHYSLIGNALERGYGVTPYVDHFGAVMSIEAVMPDGTIYRSALAENGGELIDKAFKWGIGPYIDGIFSQGNFGIVTKMTIALAPSPEHVEAFLISVDDSDLEKGVTAIRDVLKAIGGVTGSINLMNAHRVLSMTIDYPADKVSKGKTVTPELVDEILRENRLSEWTMGGIIYGDRRLVRAARKRIKSRFEEFPGRKLYFTRRKIDFWQRIAGLIPKSAFVRLKGQLDRLEEAFNVAEGAPSEAAMPLCYWKSGKRPTDGQMMNPAKDGCGVIWYSPLVPMKENAVRSYVEIVNRVCQEYGIEPLITLTSLAHRCFDSTVPILFNPADGNEIQRARQCYRALYKAGKDLGFLPYRVGVDHMDLVTSLNSSYWRLVADLKKAIDPEGIISPGRYCRIANRAENSTCIVKESDNYNFGEAGQ